MKVDGDPVSLQAEGGCCPRPGVLDHFSFPSALGLGPQGSLQETEPSIPSALPAST